MKLQQVRNATLILHYAGRKFVVDPWLSDPNADGWIGPTVGLPLPIGEIVRDVDAFFVTHTHADHFSEYGMPKDRPMYVQNRKDQSLLAGLGFADTRVLARAAALPGGVEVAKTGGVHSDRCPKLMGSVCGLVFKHPAEKTLYLAGDTIWCGCVANALDTHRPHIVVVNACAAKTRLGGRLIMDTGDILAVHRKAPGATIVASHMEAVAHAALSRQDMIFFVEREHLQNHVLVPADGETYNF